MSVRLYMDVHVPLAITEALRLRGVDILTAQQDGARELGDPELLDRCVRDLELIAVAGEPEDPGSRVFFLPLL